MAHRPGTERVIAPPGRHFGGGVASGCATAALPGITPGSSAAPPRWWPRCKSGSSEQAASRSRPGRGRAIRSDKPLGFRVGSAEPDTRGSEVMTVSEPSRGTRRELIQQAARGSDRDPRANKKKPDVGRRH